MRMPPTMKAATTAISGKKRSRANLGMVLVLSEISKLRSQIFSVLSSSTTQSLLTWQPWDQLHQRFFLRERSVTDPKDWSPLQAPLKPTGSRNRHHAIEPTVDE